MDQSRRKFFGIGVGVVAAAAIPEVAAAKLASDEAVGPTIYEHVCDGGKSRYTVEEIAQVESYGPRQWGCGTHFRWHFGVPIYCPNCGWMYESTLEALKFYKRVSG